MLAKMGPNSLALVHDVLLLAIIMIFRAYSGLLDPEKTWYVLNDRLCTKSPRKFEENNLFELFRDEIHRVNISDLHDGNGGPVSKHWFDTLDGRNSSKDVYVATAFAVLAGNIGLKNPSEVAFLRSDAFVLLKSAINSHDLGVTDQNAGNDLTQNQTTNVEFEKSSLQNTGRKEGTECAKMLHSKQRKSAKVRKSYQQRHQQHTSSIRPLQSDSLISKISLNSSYAAAYKKRKIRQKVGGRMLGARGKIGRLDCSQLLV